MKTKKPYKPARSAPKDGTEVILCLANCQLVLASYDTKKKAWVRSLDGKIVEERIVLWQSEADATPGLFDMLRQMSRNRTRENVYSKYKLDKTQREQG